MSAQPSNDQCPSCGRFMEEDADGFYDWERQNDQYSPLLQFCTEDCADSFHAKAKMENGDDSWSCEYCGAETYAHSCPATRGTHEQV